MWNPNLVASIAVLLEPSLSPMATYMLPPWSRALGTEIAHMRPPPHTAACTAHHDDALTTQQRFACPVYVVP